MKKKVTQPDCLGSILLVSAFSFSSAHTVVPPVLLHL